MARGLLEAIVIEDILDRMSDDAKNQIVDDYILSQFDNHSFKSNIESAIRDRIRTIVDLKLKEDDITNLLDEVTKKAVDEELKDCNWIKKILKKEVMKKVARGILNW